MELRLASLAAHPSGPRGRAVAIGNFDGVHRGHRTVLEACVEAARRRSLSPCVLTFHPHPASVVSERGAPPRIQTRLSRERALRDLGVAELAQLGFDKEMARLSPAEFVDQALVKGVDAGCVVVGEGFRFGASRAGDVDALRALGQGRFETLEVGTLLDGTERVSSSRLRAALLRADLAEAERLLGRPYEIEGRVVHGDHRGRTLGFPTANVDLDGVSALGYGVYAADGWIEGEAMPLPAAVNFGLRPTLALTQPCLEAHFPGFDGDLYDRTIRLVFRLRLRGERAFSSLEDLKAQIAEDVQRVLQRHPNRDSLRA